MVLRFKTSEIKTITIKHNISFTGVIFFMVFGIYVLRNTIVWYFPIPELIWNCKVSFYVFYDFHCLDYWIYNNTQLVLGSLLDFVALSWVQFFCWSFIYCRNLVCFLTSFVVSICLNDLLFHTAEGEFKFKREKMLVFYVYYIFPVRYFLTASCYLIFKLMTARVFLQYVSLTFLSCAVLILHVAYVYYKGSIKISVFLVYIKTDKLVMKFFLNDNWSISYDIYKN